MGEGGCDVAALPRHISPSVMAFGHDTSLTEGGKGVPRLRARRGDVGIAPYERTRGAVVKWTAG